MVKEHFAVRVPFCDAMVEWPTGALSKLAIILRSKADGSTKARLIVDLKRSGVNLKSAIPDRPVLPRLRDAVWDALQGLKVELDNNTARASDFQVELVSADFGDAYMHLRVREEEWCNCLS